MLLPRRRPWSDLCTPVEPSWEVAHSVRRREYLLAWDASSLGWHAWCEIEGKTPVLHHESSRTVRNDTVVPGGSRPI